MKDRKSFQKLMLLIGEKWDKKISKGMIDLIWKAIEPYGDDDCIKALNYTILHGRFWQDLIPDILSRFNQSSEDKALTAWDMLFKEIRGYNGRSLQFPDPVIHSCVESMGGLEFVSGMVSEEVKWKRKEFIDLYRHYQKSTDHPDYLQSIHEENNRIRGFRKHIDPPVMIEAPEEIKKLKVAN